VTLVISKLEIIFLSYYYFLVILKLVTIIMTF